MKYKINWLENKVGKSGKGYTIMHLVDEQGVETQNVSTFEKNYAPGMEIEGAIVQNGNFKNWRPLEAPQFIKNSGFRAVVKQDISEAQQTKAKNIQEAQDRSAWMWAKTNATTILANRKEFAEQSNEDITMEILDLATKIYNGEPLEPFN